MVGGGGDLEVRGAPAVIGSATAFEPDGYAACLWKHLHVYYSVPKGIRRPDGAPHGTTSASRRTHATSFPWSRALPDEPLWVDRSGETPPGEPTASQRSQKQPGSQAHFEPHSCWPPVHARVSPGVHSPSAPAHVDQSDQAEVPCTLSTTHVRFCIPQ